MLSPVAEPACVFCAPVAPVAEAAMGLPPAYGQLLGVGLVLILAHCSGMCGPLLLSFRFGLAQATRGGRLGAALLQLSAYQLGRGAVYACLGALAGGLAGILGDGVARNLSGGMQVIGPVIAVIFLATAGWRWFGPSRPPAAPNDTAGSLALLGRRWQELAARRPLLRAAGLGLLLAFLPCMVAAWALLLAASTGSVGHGALVMLLLVALTTPALAPFAVAPGQLPRLRARWGAQVQTAALAFSGLWMGLIALAANGVIDHRSLHLGGLEIMLF